MPQTDTQQTASAATDDEFIALQKIVKLLAPLDDAARRRILDYAVSRFTPTLVVRPGNRGDSPVPRVDMASGLGAR